MRATQIVIVMALGLSANLASAKSPSAVMGLGSLNCSSLIGFKQQDKSQTLPNAIFGWVQGWFSARNAHSDPSRPLTVGGSLPAKAVQAMFEQSCEERPDDYIFIVADDLYDMLKAKGL